jgi:FMN phosphatase YigB (HAD superfamily)
MIGDNPTSDIGGAKNCGALTFQKLHKGIKLGIGKESPDYSFNEFFELEKFIFDLFENQK